MLYIQESNSVDTVTLSPSESVGIPGDIFFHFCTDSSRTALGVQWLVNGTLVENIRLVNLFQTYDNVSKIARIVFDLPLEHNVTTIQCIYNFATKNVSSNSSTILLQGQL